MAKNVNSIAIPIGDYSFSIMILIFSLTSNSNGIGRTYVDPPIVTVADLIFPAEY